MSHIGFAGEAPDPGLGQIRRRCRLLLLLEASERAGIAPLSSARLHAFAYLADVLSPVWGLAPFDGKVYRSENGPHYTDLQEELDHLVAVGIVQVSNLHYLSREGYGSRIGGSYALKFESAHLPELLGKLGTRDLDDAVDKSDRKIHEFFVELAGALATLPDEEIDVAASVDVTYRTQGQLHSVVDYADWAQDAWMANPTWRVAEQFLDFLPTDSQMSPGEKLYLYAVYLRQVIHAA